MLTVCVGPGTPMCASLSESQELVRQVVEFVQKSGSRFIHPLRILLAAHLYGKIIESMLILICSTEERGLRRVGSETQQIRR